MSDLVSIIIPIYNKEKYLNELLTSLSHQSYSNCEFILIDDCSTDSSVLISNSYIKNDSRFKLYVNLANKGVSYSRNFGLSKAKGDFVCFVDADDILDCRYVEKLVNKFNGGGYIFPCARQQCLQMVI